MVASPALAFFVLLTLFALERDAFELNWASRSIYLILPHLCDAK
jgi:hypothetical protein